MILITETHLSEKICDSEVKIPGWELSRGDRIKRQSGGVMIMYRDQMTATNFESFSNSYVETTMLYTPASDSAWIAVYRPPNCPAAKFLEAMMKMNIWISELEKTLLKTPVIYISGDFNFPKNENLGTF